jgi:PRTRC genetic system protein E
MFSALKELLADCGELKVILKADGDKMKVFVCPPAAGTGKGVETALSRTLPLVATPEELDAGFVGAVASFRASRKSLAEQVEATKTILQAAEKDQAKKATARPAAKGGKGSSSKTDVDVPLPANATDNDPEFEDDDSTGASTESAPGAAAVTLPASSEPAKTEAAGFDLGSLL